MRWLPLFAALFCVVAWAAGPEAADSFTTDTSGFTAVQEMRYQTLTRELRCLVCQNETIADSTAALAGDMRNQVRRQILAGESNAQILKYLTDRYGDFVLYKPPFKRVTLLLWLGPLILVLIALGVALMFVRRSHRLRPQPAVDEAALKRLLDETK